MCKTTTRMFLLALVFVFSNSCAETQQMTQQIPKKPKLTSEWRLAVQTYTFRRFTFYDTVDKAAELGLRYIEAYPGQKFSDEKPDIRFDHNLSPEMQAEVKQKLTKLGIKLVNYGCVDLPNNEAACRKVFDFAKDMGIETLVAEPPKESFDLLDKLCAEYKIKLAIHNHPKHRIESKSPYWHPDKVLAVCKGRSKWIGACPDIGHWVRSGIEPVDALKKLQGRIISFHIKDVKDFGIRITPDVIWATGKANARAIMAEMYRQNFSGIFAIEYEHHSDNLVSDVRQCIENFNKIAGELKP